MDNKLKIIIGCDFAGYNLKFGLIKELQKKGYDLFDAGCFSQAEGLYAPIATEVAENVAAKKYDFGILICGTGQGMAIAANKVSRIRAAVIYDIFPAVFSREHNNANILCTGAWMIDLEKAVKIVEIWLMTKYANNNNEGLEFTEKYEGNRLK